MPSTRFTSGLVPRWVSRLRPIRPWLDLMIAATETVVFIAAMLILIAVICVDLWL